MDRIPRYRNKGYGLMFAAFAVFMIVNAAKGMFPLDLGDGPLWSKIFIIFFMTCWYGLLVAFALYGVSWLQTIEIDETEIRICLGGLVLRRISLRQVKSVGLSATYSKSVIVSVLLVLSKEDRYTLNEKGARFLKKRRVRRWMTRAGISVEGRDAAARACLFESLQGTLLRMEWSEEAEAVLRRRLHSATFFV